MKRPESYNTKQREAMLNYIASLSESHVTAAQIIEHFENADVVIGRTTVYRLLDKLTAAGKVRKFSIDGISGACFQYMGNGKECMEHFHLKCENCGELLHLECAEMDEIQRHILDKHAFCIDTARTTLYGKCDACLRKN